MCGWSGQAREGLPPDVGYGGCMHGGGPIEYASLLAGARSDSPLLDMMCHGVRLRDWVWLAVA